MIDNPIRGRFNAWFFAILDGYMHRKFSTLKSKLLAEEAGVIVELGPGTGANFRYLRAGTRIIAIEPNLRMHKVLRRRAEEMGIDLDLRTLVGEELDLPSESVDFVFSSLVLCSVENPSKVLSEVHRILRPGGRFACIEHVLAPQGSFIHRLQRVIQRPWKWLFEGCELCRDTGSALASAGFTKVDIQRIELSTIFVPIRHQVAAVCMK